MAKYKWSITVKKFAWAFAEIVVAGLIAYATDHPEFLVIVPIAEAIRNWIKHHK